MTSNKLKLLCASAGVGAVLAMTGISVVQTTTFSAEPAVPSPVTPVSEEPAPWPPTDAAEPDFGPVMTTTSVLPEP